MYNKLFGRRRKFEVNSAETTYKVHYLGNVMTSLLKGGHPHLFGASHAPAYSRYFKGDAAEDDIAVFDEEDDDAEQRENMTHDSSMMMANMMSNMVDASQIMSCVDKPVRILWDNHLKNNGHAGIKMKLTLTKAGLRVDTKDHGVTEYYGHRIHVVMAHSLHPKLLVWVYQHVGRNLKTEIRCHAALCQHTKDAKSIETLLTHKLKQNFLEYKREKRRLQNSRLCNTRNGGVLNVQLDNKKKTFLTLTQNYKPPVQHGMCSAPRLDDVLEEDENLGKYSFILRFFHSRKHF